MSSDEQRRAVTPPGSSPAIEVVLAWLDAIEQHDLGAAGKLTDPDFVHVSLPHGRAHDWQEWTAGHAAIWEALPDSRYNADGLTDHGGTVTGWFHTTATHTGHLRLPEFGIDDIAPTGRRIRLPDEPITVVVRDGKVARCEVEIPEGGGLNAFLAQIGHPPVELPS